jgi:hypothetical protein
LRKCGLKNLADLQNWTTPLLQLSGRSDGFKSFKAVHVSLVISSSACEEQSPGSVPGQEILLLSAVKARLLNLVHTYAVDSGRMDIQFRSNISLKKR